MNKYVKKELDRASKRINLYESMTDNEKEDFIKVLLNEIRDVSFEYYSSDDKQKEEIIDILLDDYNIIIHYIKQAPGNYAKIYKSLIGIPYVYLIDQKPETFDINEDLLDSINVDEGLTMEQANELLRWTSNNTRKNINICNIQSNHPEKNSYENDSLGGVCGFSQFSSLYPLQQLGLKTTVNNTWSISISHAFGTVIIPIKTNEGIIEKQFVIDCTYRQFFLVDDNVIAQYEPTDHHYAPLPGFFVMQDESNIEFAKEVLKNGFFELTEENIKYYFKPFFSFKYDLKDLDKIDEDFTKLDMINIINSEQEDFEYSKEEFDEWGMNLSLPNQEISFTK